MNPQDKFLNPRPVPKLPRLNTSPTVQTFTSSSSSTPGSGTPWTARPVISSRDTSPPTSSSSMKLFRLPRKASDVGKSSRSISPGRDRAPTGFKATLRNIVAPRAASPEAEHRRGRSTEATPVADISVPVLVRRKENSQSPRPTTRRRESPRQGPRSASTDLRLRRRLERPPDGNEDSFSAMSSFQQHRRQRSHSREPSPLRRSLTLEDGQKLREAVLEMTRPGGLESVVEVNTPQWPMTAKKTVAGQSQPTTAVLAGQSAQVPGCIQILGQPLVHGGSVEVRIESEADIDKRLPTLPNTPSSAYPVSEIDDSPMRQPPKPAPAPEASHFSSTTIDSEASHHVPIPPPPQSCFSSWTTSTEKSSMAFSDSSYARIKSGMTEFETSPTFSRMSEVLVEEPTFPQDWTEHRIHHRAQPSKLEPMVVPTLPNSDSMASTVSHTSIATSFEDMSPIAHHFRGLGLDADDAYHPGFPAARSAVQTPPGIEHKQTYQLPMYATGQPKFTDLIAEPDAKAAGYQPHSLYHARSDSKEWQKKFTAAPTQPERGRNMILPHSESMRELIEEIGYLKGMIAGGDD